MNGGKPALSLQNVKIHIFLFSTIQQHMTDSMKGLVHLSINQLKLKSKDNPRHKRIRQSELPGALVPGRATLAVSGSLPTRMKFHNIPVSLPPPPNTKTLPHLVDHSYTSHSSKLL